MREGTYFQERDKKTTMCGVVGILADRSVNQQIYDALLLLQHRGQDAAGIGTMQGDRFALFKAKGLVSDIFRTRDMRNLVGNAGIGHVRYPTQGCASDNLESQPFMSTPRSEFSLPTTGTSRMPVKSKNALPKSTTAIR